MRSSDFILGDKIYVPISTLHRLNIELDSISYIECSETSNQTSQCHRWAPPGPSRVDAGRAPTYSAVLCLRLMWMKRFPWWARGPALLVIRLSIRKHARRRSGAWLDLVAILAFLPVRSVVSFRCSFIHLFNASLLTEGHSDIRFMVTYRDLSITTWQGVLYWCTLFC